jgi:hypothetical protein
MARVPLRRGHFQHVSLDTLTVLRADGLCPPGQFSATRHRRAAIRTADAQRHQYLDTLEMRGYTHRRLAIAGPRPGSGRSGEGCPLLLDPMARPVHCSNKAPRECAME